jgi:coenzyme F420-reducing hydrogenase gamma subunit
MCEFCTQHGEGKKWYLDKQLMEALDGSFSLELLTKEKAPEAIHKLDKEGFIHSVWTFKRPFIAGLCNCDQDCMAYRTACYGCGVCRAVCNKDAIKLFPREAVKEAASVW